MTAPHAPYQSHSATSHAAATAIAPHAPSQEQRVYEAIIAHGPISDQQLAALLDLPENSVRPRRVRLVQIQRVAHAGEGRTATGRRCQLWAATPAQLGLGL